MYNGKLVSGFTQNILSQTYDKVQGRRYFLKYFLFILFAISKVIRNLANTIKTLYFPREMMGICWK